MRYIIYLLLATLVSTTEADKFYPDKFVKAKLDDNIEQSLSLVLDERSQKQLNSGTKTNNSYTPVVFWHGMGDTAYGSINYDRLALQKRFPGIQVLSIQIGNNSLEDELGGYFVNVNHQIELACRSIMQNDLIKKHKSFNAIGFSQGGQFLRGLIQRCPFKSEGIKVKNFISLGGQHQGVFGLPNCYGTNIICNHIRYLLTHAAYEKQIQDHIVQAEYWHDPYREMEYKNKNVFLADINNENFINRTYRENLLALENFVLVEFLQDDMVVPRESSLFGFYAPGQSKRVISLEESDLYLEDRLGLKELNETGRLHTIKVPGNHLQYKISWFLNKIASVYLDN